MAGSLREKTNDYTVTPQQYVKIAYFALAVLTFIVGTGAAVRLSASGLGCPDWPRCYGKPYPPLTTHSVIEFGNRVLSFFVTLGVFGAAIGAMRLRPYRRDLAYIAWLLPLGALAQAALGAFTVNSELHYGWVMSHFALSMIMMIPAVWLVWRARREPGQPAERNDRFTVWSLRGIAALTLATLLSGMLATAAGPHAGGEPGESARFEPRGGFSLEWVVDRHGRVGDALGIVVVLVGLVLWRRGASRRVMLHVTALIALIGLQGLIGALQWHYQLPAELVWLHVMTGTLVWLLALWCSMLAGKTAVRTADEPLAETAGKRPVEQVGAGA